MTFYFDCSEIQAIVLKSSRNIGTHLCIHKPHKHAKKRTQASQVLSVMLSQSEIELQNSFGGENYGKQRSMQKKQMY